MLTISPTQSAFTFPANPHFSHVVVFMLPGNALPNDSAAAVYLQLPGQPEYKLLGAIGNEKQSAIFQVSLPETLAGNVDAMISGQQAAGNVNVGISVEPSANVQAQLANLKTEASNSNALVRRPPSTKVLAQRIIKNAFNFLASFGGTVGGQEVVPLKSFQDWWTKFERRVENDPGFLERDDDG